MGLLNRLKPSLINKEYEDPEVFDKIATSLKCYSIYVGKESNSVYLGDTLLDEELNRESTKDFVLSFLRSMKIHEFKVTNFNLNRIVSLVIPSVEHFWFTDGSYLEYSSFCGYFTYNKPRFRQLLCPLCYTRYEDSINLATLISEELLQCNIKVNKGDLVEYLSNFIISDSSGQIILNLTSYEFHSKKLNIYHSYDKYLITIFNERHEEYQKHVNLTKEQVLEIIYNEFMDDINKECFLRYMSIYS